MAKSDTYQVSSSAPATEAGQSGALWATLPVDLVNLSVRYHRQLFLWDAGLSLHPSCTIMIVKNKQGKWQMGQAVAQPHGFLQIGLQLDKWLCGRRKIQDENEAEQHATLGFFASLLDGYWHGMQTPFALATAVDRYDFPIEMTKRLSSFPETKPHLPAEMQHIILEYLLAPLQSEWCILLDKV